MPKLKPGDAAPDFALTDQRGKTEKQKKFDEKYDLGFPLLADENHKVAQTWGTWGKKTLYGRSFMGIIRSAFVVDEKGKVADVFYKVSPKATVPKVTESLEG